MRKQKNFIILIITILLIMLLPINIKGADNVEWTDFSNAKFEIVTKKVNEESYSYSVKVTGVELKEGRSYKLCFHKKDEQKTETWINMNADAVFTKDKVTTPILTTFEVILEKKDDIYFTILEVIDDSNTVSVNKKIVVSNKKITRPELLPTLGNRINILFSSSSTSTYYWAPHDNKLKRTINIKIGKVNDIQILKNIKDNKNNSLQDLLDYAKKQSNYNYIGSIKYDIDKTAGITESITSKMNLENNVYYFAYIELDDEGIYYPVEDIGIYQAKGTKDLIRFGDKEFIWNNIPEETQKPNEENNILQNQLNNQTNKDTTVSTTKIPQAGDIMGYTFISALFIVLAIIGYIKFKQYKDLK